MIEQSKMISASILTNVRDEIAESSEMITKGMAEMRAIYEQKFADLEHKNSKPAPGQLFRPGGRSDTERSVITRGDECPGELGMSEVDSQYLGTDTDQERGRTPSPPPPPSALSLFIAFRCL